jgi:hypothetical protein
MIKIVNGRRVIYPGAEIAFEPDVDVTQEFVRN